MPREAIIWPKLVTLINDTGAGNYYGRADLLKITPNINGYIAYLRIELKKMGYIDGYFVKKLIPEGKSWPQFTRDDHLKKLNKSV